MDDKQRFSLKDIRGPTAPEDTRCPTDPEDIRCLTASEDIRGPTPPAYQTYVGWVGSLLLVPGYVC